METVHIVFYILQLKKCLGEKHRVIDMSEVDLRSNLKYEKQALAIIYQCDKVLKNKMILLIIVSWYAQLTG